MKKIILFIFMMNIIPLYSLSCTSYSNDPEGQVRNFFDNLVNDVIIIIQNNHNDDIVHNLLEQKFISVVDTNLMAKLAIGKYWRQLSDEDRQKYLSLYQQLLINNYVPKFKQYNNQIINVHNVKPMDNGRYIIQTNITEKGDTQTYNIVYFVEQQDMYFKIFDIVAEGVSLVATQRSDFSSIISQQGIDNFISFIEEKLDKTAL